MKPAIVYWRGQAAAYGWPMDDPATGRPMDISGLSFRLRVFLPDTEILLPGYGAAGELWVDGQTVQHPAMLMVNIAPADLVADPGRYSLLFEVNDGGGWQVMPVFDQSIIVR